MKPKFDNLQNRSQNFYSSLMYSKNSWKYIIVIPAIMLKRGLNPLLLLINKAQNYKQKLKYMVLLTFFKMYKISVYFIFNIMT